MNGPVEQIAEFGVSLTSAVMVVSVEQDGNLTLAYNIRPDAPQDVLVRLACGLDRLAAHIAATLAERGTVN